MEEKSIAKGDYTYCANSKCTQKSICARSINNYTFTKDRLYSFCIFNEKTCIYSEDNMEEIK